MSELILEVGTSLLIPKGGLDEVLSVLRSRGYQTIGLTLREGNALYAPIEGTRDLPKGYASQQDGGRYRLVPTGQGRYFDLTPGAHTWKRYLFPPRQSLFTLRREDGRWVEVEQEVEAPRYAFIGVRPCELVAIQIQDRVFMREDYVDPIYRRRREALFILAANCLEPGDTCFCASMGSGPEAREGYDLCLTELEDVFLLQIGSSMGRELLEEVKDICAAAQDGHLEAAAAGLEAARERMGRRMEDVEGLPSLMRASLEHPHWEDVARRCLSCTNCTQVCPTCFCWDARDLPDLSGETAGRERVWDSCFNPDYAYVVGGSSRPSVRSRYRQWLTHKLGTWMEQFGTLGCVGCGRCITWCPAGIDLTEEVVALRQEVR
jgi:ferredoxin